MFSGDWVGVEISADGNAGEAALTVYDLSGSSVGLVDLTLVTAGAPTGVSVPAGANLAGVAMGHLAVCDGFVVVPWLVSTPALPSALTAYAGEIDVDRFNRICAEAGILFVTATGDGTQLGPQPVADAVDVLRDAEAAGQGVLYEALTGQLAYTPLRSRYNLPVSLALDHDQGHIVAPFEPMDDDLLIRNDITVTRTGGSRARAADATSIAAVGRYSEEFSLNLYIGDQAAQLASWILHVHTVDELRYPTIELRLHKSTSLVTDWLACDIGSRVTIDNMPADVTPDLVDQIIEGYIERINSVAYDVTIVGSPYEPFQVLTLSDDVQDLGMSGSAVTLGGGVAVNTDFSGLSIDLTGMMLRLSMTVDAPQDLAGISFFLGVGGLTNTIQWSFFVGNTDAASFKPGEQTTITLQLSEIHAVAGTITLSADGVPSVLSGFTNARLRVTDDSTGAVTVTLHSVKLVQPNLSGAYCSITFDDGSDTVTSRAYPSMAALGFRGTEYPVVETVDTANHVTSTDLQRRRREGWEVGGHSYASSVHTSRYTGVTAAAAAADMASNLDWLEGNFPHSYGHTMAYPNGEFDQTSDATAVESLVTAAGYLAGRTTLSNPGVTSHLQIESLPPPIRTRLYGASGISEVASGQNDPANLVASGGMLDKLEANGGWLILTFHIITAGAASTSNECSQADFDAILAALDARDITVAPVRDVLQMLDTQSGGRLAPDDATLNAAVDSDDTAWSIRPNGARLTTDTEDLEPPLRLRVGGEVVRVTAVADPSSAPSVGAAAHADNASVSPALAGSTGDLMFLLAACRDTADSVNSVTGWSSLVTNGNMRLFARVREAGDSAPTVTFAGTAAGDTCSAQICAFPGMWSGLTGSQVASASKNNTTAVQNIDFPLLDLLNVLTDGTLTLLVAWKQDDYTSVAPPSGFTEIAEASSTTGNDQSLYWAYQYGTARRIVRPGTITVTGGGTAVSRASLTAIATAQALTVIRSANGVVKAHSLGDLVEVADAYPLAL